MVSGEMSCIKVSLFFFNLLFVISGIAIITVGSIIQVQASHYSVIFDITSPPIILIIVGIVVFVVAFFGCCGAAKKNHCMIITFSVFLLIIFTLELAAGIAGYVRRNEVEKEFESRMNESLVKYPSHKDIQKTWDIIQNDLECCGMHGLDDWQPIFKNESLPYTCCKNAQNDGTCTRNSANAFKDGCYIKLKDVLIQFAYVIGGVGIGIAIIQLIGVTLACVLARSIRREYETV